MACRSLLNSSTGQHGRRADKLRTTLTGIIMQNRNLITAFVAGVLALATTNLTAQGTSEVLPAPNQPQSGHPGLDPKPGQPVVTPAVASNLKVRSIVGLPVRNESGERLGKIQDLIVNLESHSAPVAIVEYGGTLGVGGTRVAVPLTDLKWSSEPKQLTLTATREQFESASFSPTGGWMAFAGEEWLKNVDRFYGQPSTTGQSRYERQEATGLTGGREPIRNPAKEESVNSPPDEPSGANPAAQNMAAPLADDIMGRINDVIRQQTGDGARDIQVTLKDGIVTLSGKIASDAQKRIIEDQIKALGGVDAVENRLMLPPG